MELTEKHELYVSRYISEIEEKIGDQLSPGQRERALGRLRARIDEKLKSASADGMDDTEILNLLHKMGQPETQAAILVRVWGDASDAIAPVPVPPASDVSAATATSQAPAEKEPGRSAGVPSETKPAGKGKERGPVWLGVFLYLSRSYGLPVWALRALAFLLGVATGPAALMLYMLVFILLRISGKVKAPAVFHPSRVILNPLFTGGLLTLFHFAGIYGIMGIRLLHEKYLGRVVPELHEWAWLEVEATRLFLGALLFLLPLALFSAMPLANKWDYSLKRFTQAGVVLYAIMVSFGLASFITGIILNFVNEFAG